MSIFARGLVAAMEDETNAAELAIGEAGADSAEADLVEATDISADVEAGTSEVEQATADADTLGRIADTAEAAEADGGLDPVAAEIAEIAVEAIYARLGVAHTSYPALESFSGKSGRKRATRYAVESIKETIKKIWAAVVNAFQKIVDFVKNFFNKLFDGNRKMLARINALEKKTNAAKGETTGNVKASGITKPVGMGTKDGIMDVLGTTETELKALSSWVNGIIKGLANAAGTVTINQSAGKDTSFLDTSNAAIELYKEAAKAKSFSGDVIGPRIEVKFAEKSIGDSARGAWTALTEFAMTIKEYIPFTEKPEIEALTLAEVATALKNAEKIVQFNLGQKAAVAIFESGIKKAVESAKKVAETAPDGEGQSAIVEDSRIAQRAITATGNTAIKAFTFGGKVGTEIAKAGIDYAERSLATVKATT